MKQKNVLSAFRRGEALLLAVCTLWLVWVTAGSADLSSAWAALRADVPKRLLQWELGAPRHTTDLSPAALLALSQTPQLLSAHAEVMALWQQAEEEPAPAPQRRPILIPDEPEMPEPPPAAGVDNGVPAKTLIPNDPSGYTVCGSVYISTSTSYDLSPEEICRPFAASLSDTDGPQILIVHTHGSEAYTPADDSGIVWSGDHRTTDSRYNVVRMGDIMAEAFGEAGISVLHDRTLYDYPEYSGAYDRSLAAINGYLERYPSIRFVLDVHRDAIEDGNGQQYKVTAETGEGTAAQLSLVMGSDGSGLPHPDWMENLRLAAAIQQQILTDYPTLMRPLLLRNSRYNQHATTGSLLVEVGTAGNAPEEAALSAAIFAREMAAVLQRSI